MEPISVVAVCLGRVSKGPCLPLGSSLRKPSTVRSSVPYLHISPSPPKLQTVTNHMAHKQLRFVAFGTFQGRGQSGGQRGCRHHTVQSHYSNALWESFESMDLFVLPPGKTGGRGSGGPLSSPSPQYCLQEAYRGRHPANFRAAQ